MEAFGCKEQGRYHGYGHTKCSHQVSFAGAIGLTHHFQTYHKAH